MKHTLYKTLNGDIYHTMNERWTNADQTLYGRYTNDVRTMTDLYTNDYRTLYVRFPNEKSVNFYVTGTVLVKYKW